MKKLRPNTHIHSSSSIINETLFYTASAFIIQNIAFFLSVYTRRILGPEAIGAWVLLQVFLNYAAYGNLGMLNAVCREIPILRGKDRRDQRIDVIKNVGFSYIMVISLITALIAMLAAYCFRSRLSDYMFYGLLTVAAITILQRINNYAIQLLQIEKQFIFVSKFKIYSAVVNSKAFKMDI